MIVIVLIIVVVMIVIVLIIVAIVETRVFKSRSSSWCQHLKRTVQASTRICQFEHTRPWCLGHSEIEMGSPSHNQHQCHIGMVLD